MQRAICCRIFTPAARSEYPAASLRDYCCGVLTSGRLYPKLRAFWGSRAGPINKGCHSRASKCGAKKTRANMQNSPPIRSPTWQCLLDHFVSVGANQRDVPDATPTACEAGKLVTGCFFGLCGTDTVPDVTESDGADTEVFTELGAANFSGPCFLPPFNSRSCST